MLLYPGLFCDSWNGVGVKFTMGAFYSWAALEFSEYTDPQGRVREYPRLVKGELAAVKDLTMPFKYKSKDLCQKNVIQDITNTLKARLADRGFTEFK